MCCSVRYQIYQLLVFLGALLKGPPLTPSSVLDTLNQSCHSTDAWSSQGHCLNMKCPPQAPWAWSPAGGSVWENYRTFRRWSVTRGSRSLGADFEVLSPGPTSCMWRPRDPPSCPCLPAFPSCYHVFTTVVNCIRFGTLSPNQPS